METTTHNLVGFTDEVIEVLRGLVSEGYIPDNPDLNPGVWPYGTVYTTTGTTKAQPAGQIQTDLNDVTIAWIVPLDDLAKATAYLLPFREQIPREIIKQFIKGENGNRSAHIQHPFIEIQVTLGPIEWVGGAEMFGWLITLIGSKIQNEV